MITPPSTAYSMRPGYGRWPLPGMMPRPMGSVPAMRMPFASPAMMPMAPLPTPDSFIRRPAGMPNNASFNAMGTMGRPMMGLPPSFRLPGMAAAPGKPNALTSATLNPAAQLRPVWKNDLKAMFHKNQAVIYALNIRTFGAFDNNNDGRISPALGENGTFLSAVKNLDKLVALGVNTVHVLPINPIGQNRRLGAAGSLYAPSTYHTLNPEFDLPGNNTNVLQEARKFVEECHKRNIHVMVDVPSCASEDLAKARPDLILKDRNGKKLTPTNWIDIVMFKNDAALQQYFEGFFDLMVNKVGVDGFRVDVARARPTWFWDHFTKKYPDKAWLAESYCEEDQSPLKNLPRDIPEQLLKAGFDSYYGQFHIFHSMANAKEYMDYMLSNRAMFQRASQTGGNDKSLIGSFLTHDDPSLMEHGGAPMCILASGLMTTQPWTNPYILDGFTTGYTGEFDIFNFVPQHKGSHPEIGLFMKHMLNLRNSHEYGPALTQGSFTPIPVNGGPNNQVIAFARQANGKTLLVIANKDINARSTATLTIPGLSPYQTLNNLAPSYGRPSKFYPSDNQMSVDLGPARFHIFEINTPALAQQLPTY